MGEIRIPIFVPVEKWIPPGPWEILPYPEVTRGSIREYGWGVREGLREFYQNFLDEMEEVTGKPTFYYRQDELGTWIWDYGRGILPEHWFGKPGKPEEVERLKPWWARGRYGQGMKYGSAAIIAAGLTEIGRDYIIYLWSKVGPAVYVLFIAPYIWMGRSVECLILGGKKEAELPIPDAGTVVLITQYRGPMYFEMLSLPEFRPEVKVIFKKDFEKEGVYKPNLIIEEPKRRAVYVRNIFVCDQERLRRRMHYSYDLWWVNLNPARDMVDMWDFEWELGKLLSSCPVEDVWIKVFTTITDVEYAETNAHFSAYYADEPVRKALKSAAYAVWKKPVVALKGIEVLAADRATYLGYYPLIAKTDYIYKFLTRTKVAITFKELKEKHKEAASIYVPIDDEELPSFALNRLQVLRECARILDEYIILKIGEKAKPLKEAKASKMPWHPALPSRPIGHYDGTLLRILIDYYFLLYAPYSDFMLTVYHELAHHLDYNFERDADPPSWKSVAEVALVISQKLTEDTAFRSSVSASSAYAKNIEFRPTRVDYHTDAGLDKPSRMIALIPERDVDLRMRVVSTLVNSLRAKMVALLRDPEGGVIYTPPNWYNDFWSPMAILEYNKFVKYRFKGYLGELVKGIKEKREYKENPEAFASLETWIYDPWYNKFMLADSVSF